MKKLRHAGLAGGLIMLMLALIISCRKEKNNSDEVIPEGQQKVTIRLSDNPVNYDAVFVDIQRVVVQIIPDSCRGRDRNNNDCFDDDEYRCSVWDTLDIRAGVYNLLDLSNGVDTLLASGLTLEGRINKLKLILGTNNSVVIDSVTYPLTLWNNNNTVTIQVKGADIDELTDDELQLWLDFDAGGSIVKVNNNRFVLKPRIKIFVPRLTSSIEGRVLPTRAQAVVSAVANGDTLVAIPDDHSGRFKIRGLRGTSADVFINATRNGYRDTTITGVTLQRGEETDIGTIQLRN
jgi:hypothetical protein